ncbi:DUF192 domain-containing protein [Cognatishimia maritima]|uniref:DUF192 domain-containing protein n=1 Tax=Cognatishimia maritima TaxID=870908 RepID=A0A1M5J6G2_9RHOB|nr:DUF192 domain-containing protein [Cognatishimia maritima]SHG36206.1 hypothetical protein SAMN04488044_0565 [Cognatishimia maritima]
MRHHTFRFLTWMAGVLIAALLALPASAKCSHNTVQLRGEWGKAQFTVEVADNASERSKGLMGRPSMPTSSGMLFVYHRTRPISFWMKNTLIPLDMIFADERGIVVHVHHNAIPLDETPISSQWPARYVLEVNGGLAQALGVDVGSELRHPAVLQGDAAWRCSEAD